MSVPQKKKRGCFGTIVLIVVGLIAVSIVIGVVQSMGRAVGILPTLEPTSTPTITPIPTDTPIPTVTSTPGPPTDTPIPTETPLPTTTPFPTPAPVQSTGVTYQQICDVDESNMTDPQLQAHAAQFPGQTFTGWQGWVYDVVDRGDGTYNLEIAMEERGIFWLRNIVVESIPNELALRLNVEQPIVFNGRVAKVDYTFEVMCNPMFVDSLVLQE